jgi:hypothetical protein
MRSVSICFPYTVLYHITGQLGVSHHLAPAPVVSMLLGEWTSLLVAGLRLDEVNFILK